MTAKEEKFLNLTTWYHGTSLAGWKNICKLGILADYNKGTELDFGSGFYLSQNLDNTIKYAQSVVKYSALEGEYLIPVIIEFSFTPIDWVNEGATHKFFPAYDDEFAEYVFDNRLNCKTKYGSPYDLTAGVTADTKPTALLQQYRIGKLSKERILEELKTGNSVRQLCIHNQKYCDKIFPKRAFTLDRKELSVDDYRKRSEFS